MNPIGKKIISLFLIFSLMMINCTTLKRLEERREPREKKGAWIVITKKDGQQIEGELIVVKQNSLLLLNPDGKDESIDIADIRVIRIVKKSKLLLGAGIGLLPGIVLSGILALSIEDWESLEVLGFLGTGSIAVVGAIVGAIIGGKAGKDKTIQIEGMTDSEIQETLKKLRKKARIRNYK